MGARLSDFVSIGNTFMRYSMYQYESSCIDLCRIVLPGVDALMANTIGNHT